MPIRFLHDCRRRRRPTLIRASVPERAAILLTGHKSRAIFDRDTIIHEQELLDAGDQLVAYLAQQTQAAPAGAAVAGHRPAVQGLSFRRGRSQSQMEASAILSGSVAYLDQSRATLSRSTDRACSDDLERSAPAGGGQI